ncbi:MAG: molybdopterin converting factor subunit 1 [Thermoplasmata archaeon]
MKVTVKYFAGLRDIAGKENEKIEVKEKIRIRELLGIIYKKYPDMKQAEIIVAKNRAYADENEVVEEGDEIALLPPVSGG